MRHDKFFKVDGPVRMVTCRAPSARERNQNVRRSHVSGRAHRDVELLPVQPFVGPGLHVDDDAAPLLPTGTILHVIAWYNNTAKNPRVVDPRNWKGTGHRSIDDMLILLSRYIYYTEDEFKAVLAERAEGLKQINDHGDFPEQRLMAMIVRAGATGMRRGGYCSCWSLQSLPL